MNAKRLSAAAAAVLAIGAFAAAGCGGSDDNDSSALKTSDLSKSEWIAQADRICAESDKGIEQQAGQFFKGRPTPETEAQFVQQAVVPGIESANDQIRELGAPEGDEDQVQAMLDAADQGLAKVKADPSALEHGALEEGSALSKQYGLKVCGSSKDS
jgi:hypothetical protein